VYHVSEHTFAPPIVPTPIREMNLLRRRISALICHARMLPSPHPDGLIPPKKRTLLLSNHPIAVHQVNTGGPHEHVARGQRDERVILACESSRCERGGEAVKEDKRRL
jgi:hypothetical protein